MFFSVALRRIVFLICTFMSFYVSGQVCGIYVSGSDFNNQKISFKSSPEKKYIIKLNDVFYKSYITIKTGNSKINYSKDSIFGYQDKSNTIYRFYNKRIYTILNPGETILLYKFESVPLTKGAVNVIHYYFSKNAASPVVELTIENLKNTFSSDRSFQDMLDIYFRNNEELIKYDSHNKIYKINYLFAKSLNIKS